MYILYIITYRVKIYILNSVFSEIMYISYILLHVELRLYLNYMYNCI